MMDVISILKDVGINFVIFSNDGWKKSQFYEELKDIIKKSKHRAISYSKFFTTWRDNNEKQLIFLCYC